MRRARLPPASERGNRRAAGPEAQDERADHLDREHAHHGLGAVARIVAVFHVPVMVMPEERAADEKDEARDGDAKEDQHFAQSLLPRGRTTP